MRREWLTRKTRQRRRTRMTETERMGRQVLRNLEGTKNEKAVRELLDELLKLIKEDDK